MHDPANFTSTPGPACFLSATCTPRLETTLPSRKRSKVTQEINDGVAQQKRKNSAKGGTGNAPVDVERLLSMRTASGNLGLCTDLSYDQLWKRFRDTYAGVAGYTENDLWMIHKKWKRITKLAAAGRL